jgi:hypothetical protein
MRTLYFQGCDNLERQLQIVQETSQQLTCQRGLLSRSDAIAQAQRNAIPGLLVVSFFCITTLNMASQGGLFKAMRSNPTGANLGIIAIGLVALGIPAAIAGYEIFSSCFIAWTFDRSNRTLSKESVNILKQKRVKTYRFDEVAKIGVEQSKDLDNENIKCSELFCALTSGQEFTLSQGFYTSDRREQAISLQYHREIAEKLRTYLGHQTDAADRSDRVYIPAERDRSVDWEMLKSLAGGLFSSKGKRKSKIDRIKAELTTDRENPQLWENLALHCAMNREYYCEGIDALSRAEAIYRDRGDFLKADELAQTIASFKSKI